MKTVGKNMKLSRNQTMDLVKLISSYMVVFIHVNFYGEFGQVIDTLARFAVPMFFTISGYYSYNLKSEKIITRIQKTSKVFIITICIYVMYFFCGRVIIKQRSLFNFIGTILSFKSFLRFFIFNELEIGFHLWFLVALIYVYLIFLVFRKKNIREDTIFTLSFIALIVHLCLGEFCSVFGIKVPIVLVRNFLLMGFPFFGVGLYIKKNEKRFKQVSNLCLILMLMIGVILSLVSSYLFGQNELYVGSVVVSISLMIIAIKNSEKTYSCFMNRLFECSTFIYLFHPLLHNLSQHICGKFQVDMSSMIVRNSLPILICLIVTFGGLVFQKAKKNILLK